MPAVCRPISSAIQRMLAKGIDPDDLADVVRNAQVDVLFDVCCTLDNSAHGIEDLQEKIPENVEWRLAVKRTKEAAPCRASGD